MTTKILGSLVIVGGLVIAPLSAAELNTEVVPSVAHEVVSQESDLLSIASAGALSSSSAGVQLLSASEAQEVQGGKSIFKKVQKKIRDLIKNSLHRFPPVRK